MAWRWGDHARKEFGGELLAVLEDRFHLALNKESVGEVAEWPQGEFVFHMVLQESPLQDTTRLRFKAMAVPPVSEWAAMLHVAEMIVPLEVRDLRLP